MTILLFLAAICCVFGILLGWGFAYLPDERWQMLAVLPLGKDADDTWHGLNITYYGFFVATSQLFALILLIILLGSIAVPLSGIIAIIGAILVVSLPAARLVAIRVEKKHHTFTIAGAAFLGILIAPVIILSTAHLLPLFGVQGNVPLRPTLAALALCYLLGEGLGRLGCVSYGCCYGKPVCQCGIRMQRLLKRFAFTFTGRTKKAVYEGHLGGQPLIPIQALTAVLYTMTALFCCGLFLCGQYTAALLGALCIGQAWRIISETMRADFRGFAKISAYQKMALATIFYIVLLAAVLPAQTPPTAVLQSGFTALWQPGMIISLQLVWLLIFAMFGRSSVTSATVSFSVVQERI